MSIKQKFLVIAISCFVMVSISCGFLVHNALAEATIKLTWGIPADAEPFDYFQIFDENHVMVLDHVSSDARTADLTTNAELGAYYIVSVIDRVDLPDIKSDSSNIAAWKTDDPEPPPDPVAPTPTTFNVTATVVVEPVE